MIYQNVTQHYFKLQQTSIIDFVKNVAIIFLFYVQNLRIHYNFFIANTILNSDTLITKKDTYFIITIIIYDLSKLKTAWFYFVLKFACGKI